MNLQAKDWFTALRQLPDVGYQTLLHLLPHMINLPQNITSLRSVLPTTLPISPRRMSKIFSLDANQVHLVKERLRQQNIQIITIFDAEYPAIMRHMEDPPLLLYAKGCLSALKQPILAVVGTRRPSNYGRQVAFHLGNDLAKVGFSVVSGLARGIDGEAHKGVLANKGKTIAVLGCGVDVIYPPQHKTLYDAVIKDGLVLSEYTPGTRPHTRLFPLRNRMISGMSLGVVVVEAALSSGSLNTARHAYTQNRDVFAVPGPISSPVSQGVNELLRDGAIPLTKVSDILEQYEHLNLTLAEHKHQQSELLTESEKKILSVMESAQVTVDQLVNYTSLTVQEVSRSLLNLQLQGIIHQLPGSIYTKVR